MTANKQGLFAALAENPRDLWAWCNLRDMLEAEGEPDEVLRVVDQAGTWIGSREDWEREGPLVVDRVPVVRVWVMDCAASMRVRQGKRTWRFWIWEGRKSALDEVDAEDVPEWWVAQLDVGRLVLFRSPHESQAWLTQIALEYARRMRDEKKEEVIG